MPEPLRPAANKAYARENWVLVQTIASATLAPTVAEMTAVSSIDVTNIVFADGAAAPDQNTNLVSLSRRIGDTSVFQFVGENNFVGGEWTYQFDPQAAAGSNGKKLYEAIGAGGSWYLVRRAGVPKATNFTAGQFVDVYPIEFGPSQPTTIGDGEAAQTAAKCSYAVNAAPALNKAILA